MLDVWDISNGFMTPELGYSWITLTLKKTEVSQLWGDKMDFYH